MAVLSLVAGAAPAGRQAQSAAPDRSRALRAAAPAILVLDLPSGRTLSAVQPALLATRLPAGPVLQVAALAAALESGIVAPDTPFTCRRRVTVDGRQLACDHPGAGGVMPPAQALAHSCADFFTTIGQRLPDATLNAMTTTLGLGAVPPGSSKALTAAGLEGTRATPEQLLRALVRAVDPTGAVRLRRETRDVLLAGLRGAARQGSARAVGDRAIDGLAVAWTATSSSGESQGVSLAISPSARWSRGVAVVVPGGSGSDAAAIVAETLAQLIEGSYWQAPGGGLTRKPPAQNPAEPGARNPALAGFPVRVGRLRLAGGYQVTAVPLEDYVARVLVGEAAARSAPAALEALAIAVRTFAISNLGRHRADGFDLCDTTHCQVMAAAPTPAARAAATATAGQILTYRGQPAAVFYTANCGGQSELPTDVWPRAQDQPFLVRHKDAECGRLPEWTSEIAAGELVRALNAAGLKGDEIRNVRVGRRSGSGRAATVRVEGLEPDELTGDDLRIAVGRTLGWQLIKSTAFDVKRTGNGYRFTGRGSGHGVGLCVIGSARMAAAGKTAANILAEYFPGTEISVVPSPTGSR